ncbi:MAG: integrase [Magnetospirillum gryphiswaldense]|nr:integrase [Magnetospirillum gryphiswaldense]
MAELINFTPQLDLDISDNLAGFVSSCREHLTVFGRNLDFDADQWDVTDASQQRGKSHRIRISFSNLETVRTSSPQPMIEPFKSFAKGYVRYMQGLIPLSNQQSRLGALRALEQAVRKISGAAGVELIDIHCLNRAAELTKEHWGETAAYRIGGQLEAIANFLTDNRLTRTPVKWRNPLSRPSDTERIGEAADKRRQERLPSPRALETVAIAFNTATAPADVIIASAAALMCIAPNRISEILTLPLDCEVKRQHNGKPAYGLRWWPAKGAEPMVKWVLPSMHGFVEEAIAKIRLHTEQARKVAAWYEAHPDRLWLPPEIEHLRGTKLTVPQAAACLNLPVKGGTLQWLRQNQVPLETQGTRQIILDFADLERAAIALLPNGFPILDAHTGIRFSDALLVVNKNIFHPARSTLPWMIEQVTHTHISSGLGCRTKHGVGSIFSRLNLSEDDGSPIAINTHAFRHYLNTLAQNGGLNQLEIAKWSGRKDIRQNAAYDHVTATQLLKRVKDMVGGDEEFFGALEPMRPHAPTLRAEFARLAIKTAHTTDFGYCIHDFVIAPCELHADCLNCVEHVCVKGDAAKTVAVRQRFEEAKMLLARAATAAAQGFRGANRWEDHNRLTVERLEYLLTVLDDPSVPSGSLVRMDDLHSPSRIAQADAARTLADGNRTQPPDGLDRLAFEWEEEDA